MKKLINCLFVSSIILGCVLIAKAGGLEDTQLASLTEVHGFRMAKSTDSIAMTIAYVGTSSESVVYVTSGAFTVRVPSNSTVDFSYDMAASAYDTMGELCDAIDSRANYNCSLEGAKSNDSSGDLRNMSGALQTKGGYDVLFDTGPAGNSALTYLRVGIQPDPEKSVILTVCVSSFEAVAAGSPYELKVWGKPKSQESTGSVSKARVLDDTNLVWQKEISAVGDLTANFAQNLGSLGGSRGLHFAKGAHVVIESRSDGAVSIPADFLTCQWIER